MKLLVLLSAATAFAQSSPADTQALQALVTEIRQLRMDLQTTTITTQRVQIVLFRMQSQVALVTRANTQMEDARSSLAAVQGQKKGTTSRLQDLEESLRSVADNAVRKQNEMEIRETKALLEKLTSDEQRMQSRLIDAEGQHRTEQSKLTDLQDQLDRLDKVLDALSRK